MSNSIFSLKNKTVLVVGSEGILGPVLCEAYLNFGANIVVIDKAIDQERIKKLKTEYKTRVEAYSVDVQDVVSFEKAMVELKQKFKHIDVLHCNFAWKGKSLDHFFEKDEEYSMDTWNEVMNVNLSSAFFVAIKVAKLMHSKNQGSIIFTGSIYGVVAPDQRIYEGSEYNGRKITSPAIYSASKAGLVGLTKHLAALWGKDGIRVNCIIPGGIKSGQNETFSKKYSERIPLGRMASSDDIVGGAIFLASDASSYMTGQTLVIDGGLTAW